MAAKTIAHPHVVRPSRAQDRTCLLLWRIFTWVMAIAVALAWKHVEDASVVAIAGEHLPEVADYIGEWAARFGG